MTLTYLETDTDFTTIINCKPSLAFLHIYVKHNLSISSHSVILCLTLNYQSQDATIMVRCQNQNTIMVLVLYSYLHNYDFDKCIIINNIEQSLILLYGW